MSQKKILIVDDDPNWQQILNMYLRKNNYDTAVAHDGLTAVRMAVKERPDLIVLDLAMPAGDGMTVMERLSAIPSLAVLPIIVVTCHGLEKTREQSLEAGAFAFFQKPVEPAELLTSIRAALGEPDDPGDSAEDNS